MDFIFLGLMIISLIGLITCEILEIVMAVVALKILTSILFVILGVISYKKGKSNKKYAIFIILGLIFSMFGDTFLVLDRNQGLYFYIGVVSFFYIKKYALLGEEVNWIIYYPGQAILAMSLKQNMKFEKI